MGFFKSLLKTFSTAKYRRNPDGSTLSIQERTALNVGAINAEQTMSFCDTLTTGNERDSLREKLNDYYGISDRNSAIELLHWLIETGHSLAFFLIKDHVASAGAKPIDTEELDEDALESLKSFVENLQACMDSLKKTGWITDAQSIAQMDIRAWDLGRAVLVTRAAYDCGYLSEEEAWNIIMPIYENVREHYESWHQLAASYMVGRAMWGGDDFMFTGLSNIAEGLLTDEQSPWVELALK